MVVVFISLNSHNDPIRLIIPLTHGRKLHLSKMELIAQDHTTGKHEEAKPPLFLNPKFVCLTLDYIAGKKNTYNARHGGSHL
jgi:hypothetical protein